MLEIDVGYESCLKETVFLLENKFRTCQFTCRTHFVFISSLCFWLQVYLSYNSFIDIMSKVMMQTTQWGKMKSSLESYVGFDTIQEQIRKKALK